MRLAGAAAVGIAGAGDAAAGQASFLEGFEGESIASLESQGWIFENQSDPVNGPGWAMNSDALDPPAFEGVNYLVTGENATDAFGGDVATWAILPEIADLAEGDTLSLFFRREGTNDTVLELRYSASGGTDTGSGVSGVGDFTWVLASLTDPPANGAWNELAAAVPGEGRLAVRVTIDDISFFDVVNRLGIDQVGINQVSPGPPLPGPGETVTWTLDDSPIQVDSSVAIPETGTVLVDPGVVIDVAPGATLTVDGELLGVGTVDMRIVVSGINAGNSSVTPPIRIHGLMELANAEVIGRLFVDSGGSLIVDQASFAGGGTVESADALVDHDPQYVQLTDVAFEEGVNVILVDATVAMRNVHFDGGLFWLLRGYLLTENVTMDGGQARIFREDSIQTMLVSGLAVENFAGGAGLQTSGRNYFFDETFVSQNNAFPLDIASGIEPGSVVPTRGNQNNIILNSNLDNDIGGSLSSASGAWPDLGIPYLVEFINTSGGLEVLPGATVLFRNQGGMSAVGGRTLRLLGTPEAPITLTRQPGESWSGIEYLSNVTIPRVESVILEHSENGLIAEDSTITLVDSILRNNGVGSNNVTFGLTRVRKSQLLDNAVGARASAAAVSNGEPDLFGQTMPNAIVGNGVGVEAENPNDPVEARFNWWGSPTGPDTPGNPGGAGDAAIGPVEFLPFLTAAPDFDDHPPVVRVERGYPYAEPGDKVLLTWTAVDDGAIVSQRVEYSLHGEALIDTLLELSPDARQAEVTIPDSFPSNLNEPAVLRVVATDDAGQEGWDRTIFDVPYLEDWSVSFAPDLDFEGQTLTSGEIVDICWQTSGASGTIDAFLLLDADQFLVVPLGGGTTAIDCLPLGMTAPYVTTDAARIAYRFTFGAAGRFQWFFSEPFAIRPDERLGDEPPSIELTSPAPGATLQAGTVETIAWNASDDDSLRRFAVHVSYSSGRSWAVVADDLAAEATSFDWLTPPSEGVGEASVRVVAVDRRFQNATDTIQVTIAAGDDCPGDFNGDGDLNILDFITFQGAFQAQDSTADCNMDGVFNILDFICFQAAFEAGCP